MLNVNRGITLCRDCGAERMDGDPHVCGQSEPQYKIGQRVWTWNYGCPLRGTIRSLNYQFGHWVYWLDASQWQSFNEQDVYDDWRAITSRLRQQIERAGEELARVESLAINEMEM